jgi:hypothetical protein
MTIVKAMRPWLLTAITMPPMAMTNAISSTELMTVPDAYREFNDHNRTTGKSQNARYVMQINSRSNTLSAHTPIPTNRSKSPQWAITASNAISL